MDNCIDGITGFDPIGTAPVYSALAGVIAGVLFTGIVLLVSVPARGPTQARQSSLEVLVPTLFAALLCSFLYGVMAGEGVCGRADAEGLAAGVLLGLVAVSTFLAVAWMLHSVDGGTHLDEISGITTIAVAIVAVAQISITLGDVLADYYPAGPAGTAILCGVLVVGVSTIALPARAWWMGSPGRIPGYRTMISTFATVATGLIAFNFAASSSPAYWDDPGSGPPPWIFIFAPLCLLALLASVTILLGSLPPRSSVGAASPEEAGAAS